MLDFRSVPTTRWYGLVATGTTLLAAYVSVRSSRQTRTAIAQLAVAVDDLTLQAKRVDYWTIYRHVQHDLLVADSTED